MGFQAKTKVDVDVDVCVKVVICELLELELEFASVFCVKRMSLETSSAFIKWL